MRFTARPRAEFPRLARLLVLAGSVASAPAGIGVGSLFVDARGAIWFTSQGLGVCRDDGTSLTTLTPADGLQSHAPLAITEDDRQSLVR